MDIGGLLRAVELLLTTIRAFLGPRIRAAVHSLNLRWLFCNRNVHFEYHFFPFRVQREMRSEVLTALRGSSPCSPV